MVSLTELFVICSVLGAAILAAGAVLMRGRPVDATEHPNE